MLKPVKDVPVTGHIQVFHDTIKMIVFFSKISYLGHEIYLVSSNRINLRPKLSQTKI